MSEAESGNLSNDSNNSEEASLTGLSKLAGLNSEQKEGPSEKFGIVIILDALGVRNLSIRESKNFLAKKDVFVKDMALTSADIIGKLLEEQRAKLKKLEGESSNQGELSFELADIPTIPDILTFGDTIILAWEVSERIYPKYLIDTARIVGKAFAWSGLGKGLLLRGAISVGKYLIQKKSILGPAVSDAAFWHQHADWMGVIATPNCSIRLSLIEEFFNQSGEKISPYFSQYNVPLIDNSQKKLWSLSWPFWYLLLGIEKPRIRSRFLFDLECLDIPFGTESKYFNTIEFFDTFHSDYKFNVDELRPFLPGESEELN